ncbi:hypothetical protein L195_g055531, partial [Trifolium pratense]
MKVGGEMNNCWFSHNISNVLGKGNSISFWNEKWLGPTPLKILFPSLYNSTLRPLAMIEDMGTWNEGRWSWNLLLPAELLPVEEVAVASLFELLANVHPVKDKEDRRRWIPYSSGIFSVHSAYIFLQNQDDSMVLNDNV